MKKERAEYLVKKHQKFHSSQKEKLTAVPIFGGQDEYCVVCHSSIDNEPLFVYHSEHRMNSTVKARKKLGKEMGWW